jgi:hypothetical protein
MSNFCEFFNILLENKKDKKHIESEISCFLSNYAPSFEDANKIIDGLTKKDYDKICKKLNKKTA